MSIGGDNLEKRILHRHIMDTSSVKAGIKEMDRAEAEHARKSQQRTASMAESLVKLGGTVIGVGAAWKAASASLHSYLENTQLARSTGDVNIRALQKSFHGLVTSTDTAKFAAAALASEFKVTQREMNIAAQYAVVLASKTGQPVSKAFDAVKRAVTEANVEAFKPFGWAVGDATKKFDLASGSASAFGFIMNKMAAEVAKSGGKVNIAGKDMQQSIVKAKDAIDDMKTAIGKIVIAAAPMIQRLADMFTGLATAINKPREVLRWLQNEVADALGTESFKDTLKIGLGYGKDIPLAQTYTIGKNLPMARVQELLSQAYAREAKGADLGALRDLDLRMGSELSRAQLQLLLEMARPNLAAPGRVKIPGADVYKKRTVLSKTAAADLAKMMGLNNESMERIITNLQGAGIPDSIIADLLHGDPDANLGLNIPSVSMGDTMRRTVAAQTGAALNRPLWSAEKGFDIAGRRESEAQAIELIKLLGKTDKTFDMKGALAQFQDRLPTDALEQFGKTAMGVFNGMEGAAKSAFMAMITGSESAMSAFRKMAGNAALGGAAEMAVMALKEIGMAAASLALGPLGGVSAAGHAKAAALFAAGSVAALGVAAAMGVSGNVPTVNKGSSVGGSLGGAGISAGQQGNNTVFLIGDDFTTGRSRREQAADLAALWERASRHQGHSVVRAG